MKSTEQERRLDAVEDHLVSAEFVDSLSRDQHWGAIISVMTPNEKRRWDEILDKYSERWGSDPENWGTPDDLDSDDLRDVWLIGIWCHRRLGYPTNPYIIERYDRAEPVG